MANASIVAEKIPANQPSDTIEAVRDLILDSMFWRPAYLAQSAWLEHVPFAFWLIEAHKPKVVVELGTHYGVSYFAFCQAIDRLGLDTSCFAVDTWKGDEHAGFYPESVFQAVNRFNTEKYSAFSRLVRSTFDEASSHFLDGSIDLLHIDGLHTLESVRHDFETWLPKLSESAIVLLHDTNVRERGFGVSHLFESLRRDYPCFEFVHGHGLGVVCRGRASNSAVGALLAAEHNPSLRHTLRGIFGGLGRSVADSHVLGAAGEQLDRLQAAQIEHQTRLKTQQGELESLRIEVAAKTAEAVRLEQTIGKYERTLETRFFELARLTEDHERERTTNIHRDARLQALGEIEQNYRAMKKSHDEILHYARKLEREYLSVLTSTSWRILEPARAIARRLTGKKGSKALFKPRL